MTKSALVKIGVPSEQASSMKRVRRMRQLLEQHDAAVQRLTAALEEGMRQLVNADTAGDEEESSPAEATA